MTRLLCWFGLHRWSRTVGRSGYVEWRVCRRPHCLEASIRKGL